MDPRLTKRREIGLAIYYAYKAKRESGALSEQTFKKNFPRGAVATKGSAAYKQTDTEYRAWLKENGYPMPKSKAATKKKPATKSTKAATKKKPATKSTKAATKKKPATKATTTKRKVTQKTKPKKKAKK